MRMAGASENTISQNEQSRAKAGMIISSATIATAGVLIAAPVSSSVAITMGKSVAEGYAKSFLGSLMINTLADAISGTISGNHTTPLEEINKTFRGTDMADPIISAIPGADKVKTATALMTAVVDFTPEGGLQSAGNKPIENMLFDGITNKMNDNYEKVIKNSNWSKNAENFASPIMSKITSLPYKDENGNKAKKRF
jgi:hypothetical protein